jgi:hypothetical protein
MLPQYFAAFEYDSAAGCVTVLGKLECTPPRTPRAIDIPQYEVLSIGQGRIIAPLSQSIPENYFHPGLNEAHSISPLYGR